MAKLLAVAKHSRPSRQYNQGVPLQQHAARLYPCNAHNQAQWVKAVQFLRSHQPSIWKLDTFVNQTPNTQRY